MATKLYLTAKSPSTALAGPVLGAWSNGDSRRDARDAVRYVFLADPSPTLGGVVSATGTTFGASLSKAANQKLLCAGQVIWVTPPLATGGTLSGTVTITMKVRNAGATTGGPAVYHVHAYISQGDTLTLRQVAVDNYTDATAWTTTHRWRSVTSAIAGTYQAGDRLVFEIGASASPPTAPAGDTVLAMSWGTTEAAPTYTVLADAVDGSSASFAAAWLQLTSDLTFTVSAPPANDACTDAVAIASLPYSSSAIDTTGSLDADKAVWFTWTAPSTVRVLVTTRGSNYATIIQVYRGCGGASVSVGDENQIGMWSGRAQSLATFIPEWGMTYAIKVTAGEQGLFGAVRGNGSLSVQMSHYSAPQTDDLFVNCQHIVCFRGQTAVNWMPEFYGFTPTGAAIDATRRPMTDLVTGDTHTDERYYFCLFGSGGWLEILDLATLNVGRGEIDFIFDLWDGNDNPSSVVFDGDGNIVVGWYGNHYDVNGSPATDGTANIRLADATQADNQPGHPFPPATSYAAAIEDGGTDFVELSADQDTIFYTSSGTAIKRWSRTTGQLADWATVPASTGPRPGAHGLRLLPPSGTGADGLVVTNGPVVLRLDATGAVVQTYTPTPSALAQDLDKIEITHDRLHFWVSDQLSAHLFKFNLTSGAQVDHLDTGLPTGQLSGFAIYQGYRAGDPPPENGGNGGGGGEPGTRLRIRRVRRAPHLSAEQAWQFFSRFQLDLEPGVGSTGEPGVDPQVTLRWSDDGGHSWHEPLTVSAGLLGEYKRRAIWRRLGRGRDRVFEIIVDDPVKWALVAAYLEAQKGTS